VRIHQGTSEALGRVALAGRSGQPAPGELTAGAAGYARLRLETPLVLTRADRFIVRSYSPLTTIGGGVVLDPQPRRGGVRTDAGGERLQRLDLSAPEADLVRELLRERGPQGVSRGLLVSRAGLSPAAATTWIETLVADGSAVEAGPVIVSTEWAGFLGEMVVAAVDRHHRDAPLEEGLPREEARARIFARMPPHLFDTVLSRLVEQGMVEGRDRLWRAGRAVGVSDEDARGLEALEQAVRDAGFEALDQKAAIEVSGLGGERGEGLLRLLLHRGRVVRLGTLLFHRDMLDRVVADVRAVRGTGETSVDVGSFKARYGLSRKYAMPLLEYLDRERITRRVGDRRLIL
jgi:selenocysteine-specific elongation factor